MQGGQNTALNGVWAKAGQVDLIRCRNAAKWSRQRPQRCKKGTDRAHLMVYEPRSVPCRACAVATGAGTAPLGTIWWSPGGDLASTEYRFAEPWLCRCLRACMQLVAAWLLFCPSRVCWQPGSVVAAACNVAALMCL